MPSLENAVPLPNQNQLARREMRSKKVVRYLQITEVSRCALSLRREAKAWENQVKACHAMGIAGIESAATATKALLSTRAMLWEIIGMPKRPARPVLKEQTARVIRDALPEEILVPEEPISGPATELRKGGRPASLESDFLV